MTRSGSGPADESPVRRAAASPPSARQDKAKHQSDLLDEGLKETFPASDPVSVVRVK